MSGFMKTVLKNWTRVLSRPFFLARNSKVENIKIKRKVSPFFSFPYPFIFLFLPSLDQYQQLDKSPYIIVINKFTLICKFFPLSKNPATRIRNISYRRQSNLPEHFLRMWNIFRCYCSWWMLTLVECGWCDASYVDYTSRHLYQRIDEHKRSLVDQYSITAKVNIHQEQ